VNSPRARLLFLNSLRAQLLFVSSPRARLVGAAILVATAASLIALTVVLAGRSAEPPSRCAAGMIPLGARCCGEGQRLERGRCVGPPRACAAGMSTTEAGCVHGRRLVRIPGGSLRVGPGDWEAQGVIMPYQADIPTFELDQIEVTEERFAPCIAARVCPPIELSGEPGRAVARVTAAEASTFCRAAGGELPTPDQLAFAAAGSAGRRYAWGDTGAVCRRAAFGLVDGPCARGADGPDLAGAHLDGASPEGVLDLAGNVAEWTRPATPDAVMTEVRGGSFADGAAAALRSWQRRVVPVNSRSPEVGFRCAYAAP
jgi:formylglycine-generating enzyme